MNLEPAHSIIEIMGGPQKVAEITGRHYSRVYRWSYPSSRGGTDGVIPAREQQKILRFARENAVDLQPSDFFDESRLKGILTKEAAE